MILSVLKTPNIKVDHEIDIKSFVFCSIKRVFFGKVKNYWLHFSSLSNLWQGRKSNKKSMAMSWLIKFQIGKQSRPVWNMATKQDCSPNTRFNFKFDLVIIGLRFPDEKRLAFRNLVQVPKVWSVFIRASFSGYSGFYPLYLC